MTSLPGQDRATATPVTTCWPRRRSRFGRQLIEQNGRIPLGCASYLALYPADSLIVIVLSNIQSDAVVQIGVGLAAIGLGERYTVASLRPGSDGLPAAAPVAFGDFPGRYEIAPGFELTVRATAAGLLLAGPDGAFLPLDHQGADQFFFRPLYVPIRFERDARGAVTLLDWGGQFRARRLNR